MKRWLWLLLAACTTAVTTTTITATMVDPAYLHTGVGVAVDSAGRLWICQIFGGTALP